MVKAKERARADTQFDRRICRWRTVDDACENYSEDRVSSLRSKETLGKRPRMRNVFLQFVYTKSNTYNSYGRTTATYRPSEPYWSVFFYEYSDDLDTSSYMVGQQVPLPGATEQVPLTPTASATVDTKDTATFDARAMDDNDELWTIQADHRTGWNKTFKSGTYRGILYGAIFLDYPKQVVSLTKAKSVPMNMREFFSWAQRHHRIDATTSTVERKTGGMASAGTCPGI